MKSLRQLKRLRYCLFKCVYAKDRMNLENREFQKVPFSVNLVLIFLRGFSFILPKSLNFLEEPKLALKALLCSFTLYKL